jgi:hypothetical protein
MFQVSEMLHFLSFAIYALSMSRHAFDNTDCSG